MLRRPAGMLALAGVFYQNYKLKHTITKRGVNLTWFMPCFLLIFLSVLRWRCAMGIWQLDS